MTVTVALRARSLDYPQGGGAFWVYLNWALALRAAGCNVVWLETYREGTGAEVGRWETVLDSRLARFGLSGSLVVFPPVGTNRPRDRRAAAGMPTDGPTEADLLLDLAYTTPDLLPALEAVCRFRRSALVDIDPGLLQVWVGRGDLVLPAHDLYFTIGETVGTPSAAFPDCGVEWHYTPPPIALHEWPPTEAGPGSPYTTVSHWWHEWLVVDGEPFDNSKRVGFEPYLNVPSRTSARFELALDIAASNVEECRRLERLGWTVRNAWEVAGTPDDYRTYVQSSRGEFSCAKPSCLRLRNAWVSDRTLCYLASGKPAIVEHTGESTFLPDAEGLFRFRDRDGAVRALRAAEEDYARHCSLARALVEEHFDGRRVVERVLERALA